MQMECEDYKKLLIDESMHKDIKEKIKMHHKQGKIMCFKRLGLTSSDTQKGRKRRTMTSNF